MAPLSDQNTQCLPTHSLPQSSRAIWNLSGYIHPWWGRLQGSSHIPKASGQADDGRQSVTILNCHQQARSMAMQQLHFTIFWNSKQVHNWPQSSIYYTSHRQRPMVMALCAHLFSLLNPTANGPVLINSRPQANVTQRALGFFLCSVAGEVTPIPRRSLFQRLHTMPVTLPGNTTSEATSHYITLPVQQEPHICLKTSSACRMVVTM